MARALKNILATATKKKPKKRATSLATLKLGDEPSFIASPTKAELVRALNWYTQCAEDSELHKAWVAEYMSENGFPSDQINTIKTKIKKLIPTYIFVARMLNRAIPLDDKYQEQLNAYLTDYAVRHTEEEELDDDGQPIVVKAPAVRASGKITPMVLFIEDQIDAVIAGAKPESVYTKLQEMGCNASTAAQLRNIFKYQTAEFIELSKVLTCDDDLLEAYRHISVPVKKALGAFSKQLNDDLTSFAQVAKATRKPRKKKPVKLEKLVARVKYKAKDDTYKIASLPPERIIKASWLWTFNTKYRVIAWYEAAEGGLSVKGTTVTNFKASGQKKLRKPEQQLAGFTAGAVKALPKNFAAIKTTEVESPGRLNSDTIILRVF